MFWKRKNKTIFTQLGPVAQIPIPAKKEFETMFEILKDAEKYDHAEEYGVSDMVLKDLVKYINDYIKT